MAEFEGRKVLLLSSGGPDSATAARLVEESGAENVGALFLRSGNPADEQEIKRAKEMCAELGIGFRVVDISDAVSALGGGALMRHAGARLIEFGPAVMHSIAIAYAHRIGADLVAIGLHRDDAEAGPQYTAAYLEQLNVLARLTHPSAPQVVAPLIGMRKHEVFAEALRLGVDFARTRSCIRAGEAHCGKCPACEARAQAFADAGIDDPTLYEQPLAGASRA